jgi:DNA-binding transcriptional ArsR family regulator
MNRGLTYGILIAVIVFNIFMGTRWVWAKNDFVWADIFNLLVAAVMAFVLWSTIQRNRFIDEQRITNLLRRKPMLYLAQITQETGLSISTVVVTVFRLEQRGVLTSVWQDGPEPRNRLYRLA